MMASNDLISNSLPHIIDRHDAKDGVHLLDKFQQFRQYALNQSEGQLLKVCSYFPDVSDFDAPKKGGGIGKTKILEYFYIKNDLQKVAFPIIDFFEETTTFRILTKVFANLWQLLGADDALFTRYRRFLSGLDAAAQENVADNLSSQALLHLKADLEAVSLREFVQSFKKKHQWIVLFFDSFEYVEQEKNPNGHKNYNYELYQSFITEEQALLPVLLKSGISLVLSGRIVKAFDVPEAQICHIGALKRAELVDFIRNVKLYSYEISETEFLKIEKITESRPIMVDIVFEVLKKRQNQQLSIAEDDEEADAPSEKEISKEHFSELLNTYSDALAFETDIFKHLHLKTESRNASTALYYMSIARYGVTEKMIAQLLGWSENKERMQEIVRELSAWSYTKKPAWFITAKMLPQIQKLVGQAGIRTEEQKEYRLHDEMTLLIHTHYWKSPKHSRLQQRFFNEILHFYKTEYSIDLVANTEHERRRLREYCEYKLEMIHSAPAQNRETWTTATLTEMAYHVVATMDQYPDHAKRLLEKAASFFEQIEDMQEPFWKKSKRLLDLLQMDFEIAVGRYSWVLDQKITIEADILDNQDFDARTDTRRERLAQRSKAFAQRAEAAVSLSRFEEADQALQQSARFAYESGDSVAIAWVTHLQGFYLQRQARFLEAQSWHTAAMDSAYHAILSIREELLRKSKVERATAWGDYWQLKIAAKVITRALGNIAYNTRIRGDIAGSINYIKLLLYNQKAIRAGSKEIGRSLIGLYRSYALMGYEVETQVSLKYLKNIHYEYDTGLVRYFHLSEVRALLKKIPIAYIHLFTADQFPEQFKKRVSTNHTELLETAKNILIQKIFKPAFSHRHIDAVTTAEIKAKPNRDIAEMFYLYGKTCLQMPLPDTGFPDFDRAEQAFLNATVAAQKAEFKYIEVQAQQSLFTLSYLKTGYDRSKIVLEIAEQRQKEGLKIFGNEYSPQNKDLYHDLFAKFYATAGNLEFEKAHLESYKILGYTESTRLNLVKSFESYAYMVLHGYLHNENRYDLSVEILTRRFEKIVEAGYANYIRSFFLTKLKAIFELHQVPFDTQLSVFLDTYRDALTFCRPLAPLSDAEHRFQISSFVSNIYNLNDKGRHHQALLLSDWLLNYHKKFKNVHTEWQQENRILAYYHHAYCLQLNHKSAALQIIQDGIQQLELLKRNDVLSKPKIAMLNAVLKIRELVSQYRTQEFWNIERFVKGELKYFVSRFNRQSDLKISDMIAEMGVHLGKILSFCQDERLLAQKPYRYLRLLSEGCFRLGELCLLTEQDYDLPESAQLNEGLKDLYQKLSIETGLEQADAWENTAEQIQKHQKSLNSAYSGAVYLSYAYQFCKWIGDAHGAAQSLETIANLYYFKGQFESKRISIPPTVKYYCLTNEIKEKYQQKDDKGIILHPQGSYSLKTAFLKESDFEYPLVMAQMKIVEGDAIFSQIFELDVESYEKIDRILQSESTQQPNNHLIVEHYKVRNDYKQQYSEKDSKYRIHIMFLNYLKALNLLAVVPYRSFIYDNMVSEIIRRLLLIQEPAYLKMIEQDLGAIWLSFNNLQHKSRRDTLQQLLLTAKVHQVGLWMKDIFNTAKSNPISEHE